MAQTHRLQKILFQNFSGGDVRKHLAFHKSSVVIDDLNFVRARFPTETDPTLIVILPDVNTPLQLSQIDATALKPQCRPLGIVEIKPRSRDWSFTCVKPRKLNFLQSGFSTLAKDEMI